MEFFKKHDIKNRALTRCKTCGKDLEDEMLTHCSNQCLFASIWNSKSISGDPIETWDEGESWV